MTKRSGDIKTLGSLFQIYKERLVAPQKSVTDAALEVIRDVTGITLLPHTCTYTPTTRTLKINASAMIRQELKRHEAEILAHLKGRVGERSVPKIML
jgi:hypothetical protein